MRVLFVLLLAFAVPSGFYPTDVHAAVERRCAKCGKQIVRCPSCGKWHHPSKMPTEFAAVEPALRSPAAELRQGVVHSAAGSVAPVAVASEQPAPRQRPAAPLITEASLVSAPVSAPSVRSTRSLFAPARGGAADPNYNASLLFHYNSTSGDPIQCNGAVVGKQLLDQTTCYFPLMTARHCLQDSGSITRDRSFGRYIVGNVIELEGAQFKVHRVMDTSEDGPDVALAFLTGPCNAIPDSKVGKLAASPPGINETVYARKSRFWGSNTVFETPDGRRLSFKHESNQLMRGRVGRGSSPSYLNFAILNGWRIRPGDSGSPVYNQQGEIIGTLSHGIGQPDFSDFEFGSDVNVSAWARLRLTEAGFGI